MKTLKYEQVYLSEYENLSDARAQIGYFLEAVYNQKRLPSSLGYLPPTEFEQAYQEDKRNRDKNQTVTPLLIVSHEGFTPRCSPPVVHLRGRCLHECRSAAGAAKKEGNQGFRRSLQESRRHV